MSWFEDWFNSPLYEKLYSYRNEDEAELLAKLIEKEIPKSDFPDILDLGCGRGRHSITLAELGYEVTGIDLSPEAIKKARSIASEKKLKNVTFKVEDMRNPLPKTFDAIVNLFTTFGYFLNDAENERVLDNVTTMLKSEGVFFMDYLNSNIVRNSIVPDESGSYGNLNYTIKRKIESDMVYKTIQFSGDSLDEPVEYQERVKLYDLDWFEQKFRKFDFQMQSVYGNYKGAKFDPETSSRLIMIAQKTG